MAGIRKPGPNTSRFMERDDLSMAHFSTLCMEEHGLFDIFAAVYDELCDREKIATGGQGSSTPMG